MIYRSARRPLEDIGGTLWTVTVDAFLLRTHVVLARLSEVCMGGARRVDAVSPSRQPFSRTCQHLLLSCCLAKRKWLVGEDSLEGAEEQDIGVLVSALSWHLSRAQWVVPKVTRDSRISIVLCKKERESAERFCMSHPDNRVFIFKGFSFSPF